MALSQVEDFAKQLCDLQEQMTAIREDLNAIRHPLVRQESLVVPDPSTCIKDTSWAKEMDIRNPIEDEYDASSNSHVAVRLVDVGPQTRITSAYQGSCNTPGELWLCYVHHTYLHYRNPLSSEV